MEIPKRCSTPEAETAYFSQLWLVYSFVCDLLSFKVEIHSELQLVGLLVRITRTQL